MLKLGEKTYDDTEINACIELFKNDSRLTIGENVKNFEDNFAKYTGSKYAIMVNSGSSANLLAVSAACNPSRKKRLFPGDKVYVPSICWSTSVFPLIQHNLVPVFLDVNFENINIEIEDLDFEDIKGIMCVHVMGNCTRMLELMKISKEKGIIVIEDTCESLGTTYKDQMVGTFGDFGTFSFYFSHHITTIEGGMVVCDDEEDYYLLKCLRSHGWSRDQKKNFDIDGIDNRFCFINIGYNLRPMEIQGVMGNIQLSKLNKMSCLRKKNRDIIVNKIINHKYNLNIIGAHSKSPDTDTNWFSVLFYLKIDCDMKDFLNYLTENGIENRPIVSGNFSRQPVLELLNINLNPKLFPNSEKISNRSFYIGCPTFAEFDAEKIADTILNYWGKISFYKEPYMIKKSLPFITDCLDRTWISYKGKYNSLCEEEIKKIVQKKYVLLTNSGTSAIKCMIKGAKKLYPDVKKIYAPNNIYIALWNILIQEYPIEYLKCIDLDEETLNIENLDIIEQNSILFVVHNISGVTNIPLIKKKRPDIIIFEDASEGYFGKYDDKMVGSEGVISTLSFNMNKHLTCGGGGAFCTNNLEIFEYLKKFCYQGLTNKKFCYDTIGENLLMPDINASILYSQIEQSEEIMKKRENIYRIYEEKTKDICKIQTTCKNTVLSYWFVCLKISGLESYKKIENYFKERNIELRPMFYGLQEFEHFPKSIFPEKSNYQKINNENFIVPCYPSITEREINRVVKCLKDFIESL